MKDEILTHLNDPSNLKRCTELTRCLLSERSVHYIRNLKATHLLISGMKD